MKCPRFQHEDLEGARFLNKCGYTLRKIIDPPSKDFKRRGEAERGQQIST
jgi:hypothetical protein